VWLSRQREHGHRDALPTRVTSHVWDVKFHAHHTPKKPVEMLLSVIITQTNHSAQNVIRIADHDQTHTIGMRHMDSSVDRAICAGMR
jgi:hypothetical protein